VLLPPTFPAAACGHGQEKVRGRLAYDVQCTGESLKRKFAPHRTAPHRTAPHRTAPHRTAPASLIDLLGPDRYRHWRARESFAHADQRLDRRRVA
jgi:hypothetical protein